MGMVMTMKNALKQARNDDFIDNERLIDALAESMRAVRLRTKEQLLRLHSTLVDIFGAENVPDPPWRARIKHTF